jgi:Protein of unknown function (DUF2442)
MKWDGCHTRLYQYDTPRVNYTERGLISFGTVDDGSRQVVDFRPVLVGEIYGPLQDEKFFNQVEIDPEVHTLVWPNGADFDPATLHDWPKYIDEMKKMVERWGKVNA